MEPASRQPPDLRLVLVALSFGYFMVLFDTTALTVALPDIARSLGAGVQGLAWVTDAYTLTFAACLLTGGVIADRHGADRTFLAGLAGFGALSLVCAAAPSTGALIGARALLGVAGALLLPASLSLIAGLFEDPARRAGAIATWASISGSALAAGPLLGGVLVGALGWRGIFLVNAPVAVVAWLLLRGRLPRSPRSDRSTDVGGQLAVLVTVGALTWALIRGGAGGWWSADVLVAFGVAAAAAFFGLRSERAASTPVIPPGLLRAPGFGAVLVGGLVVGGALAGELFLSTLQLQEVRHLGPVVTGLAFLPLTVPMVVGPPLAGRVVARVGSGRPVLAGLLMIAAAATVLAITSTGASYLPFAFGLALLGSGVAFTLPALTAAAVLAAPAEATGAASGIFLVVRQTGATFGVAAAAATIGADIAHASRGHVMMAGAAVTAAILWQGTRLR